MCTQSHCPVSLPSLCGTDESYRDATTINMLPDNVLLEIFDLYRKNRENVSVRTYYLVWKWHLLVHVCRSWRQLIFASPHRLHLRIFCTERSPVRNDLGIWPAFPIVIGHSWRGSRPEEEENIIAALEQPNRVYNLKLFITGSELEKMAKVMQQTFPLLTCLGVLLTEGNAPVLSDGFLGGSAPRLTSITLGGIPYPALPTLLLSTSDLVLLNLHGIPPTGYISSEAMALSLATLPRLEVCTIGFQSATPHPDRIRPPPVTRAVLPALTFFKFIGAIEYLDDLVSQIDGPQLKQIFVDYLNHFVDFPVAQISQFINRSVGPELTPLRLQAIRTGTGAV
ncbi:hypothetical protein EDB89DRAFT_2163496 [Lactarius sanguifluus]|nr:hypothetical protein EDB89DRAFT_2163496 [Lactarius sanguifluus]